jgi:hypothetical protein
VIFAAPLVGFAIGVLLARYDLLNRTLAWVKAMTVRWRLRHLLNAELPALRQAQPLTLPAAGKTISSAMAEPEMAQLIEVDRDRTLFRKEVMSNKRFSSHRCLLCHRSPAVLVGS